MRLVRVGRAVWDVVAIEDADGHSVLTELDGIDPSYYHAETMRVLIEQHVPRNGPPAHNKLRCSPLGDGIFEFKTGPETGQKLRVLWFYDSGDPIERRRIVCTHSFLKKTRKTPPGEKDRALLLRREYLDAKALGALEAPSEKKE